MSLRECPAAAWPVRGWGRDGGEAGRVQAVTVTAQLPKGLQTWFAVTAEFPSTSALGGLSPRI